MKQLLGAEASLSLSILVNARARLAGVQLPPGASATALHAAEAALGVALPAQVRAFYRMHDGGGADLLLDGHQLLSLDEMVGLWRLWRNLKEEGVLDGLVGRPTPGVRADFWNPRWIPMTQGRTTHHCLDLDPAPGGEAGQLILLWQGEDARPQVAPSFIAFLRQASWSAAVAPPPIRWSAWWTRLLFEGSREHTGVLPPKASLDELAPV